MSFFRHKQIYRPMFPKRKRSGGAAPVSSSDESATGYSLASCTPALLASASPADCHGEPDSRKLSTTTWPGLGNFRAGEMGKFHLALTDQRTNSSRMMTAGHLRPSGSGAMDQASLDAYPGEVSVARHFACS